MLKIFLHYVNGFKILLDITQKVVCFMCFWIKSIEMTHKMLFCVYLERFFFKMTHKTYFFAFFGWINAFRVKNASKYDVNRALVGPYLCVFRVKIQSKWRIKLLLCVLWVKFYTKWHAKANFWMYFELKANKMTHFMYILIAKMHFHMKNRFVSIHFSDA